MDINADTYGQWIKKWLTLYKRDCEESKEMLEYLKQNIAEYDELTEKNFIFIPLIVTNESGNVFFDPVKVFLHAERFAYKTTANGNATVFVDVIAVKKQAFIHNTDDEDFYNALFENNEVKPIKVKYHSGSALHFPYQEINEYSK